MKEGFLIGPYDVLMAAQAREKNLTMVTRNLKEFSRVEGLTVDDWRSGSEGGKSKGRMSND